MWILILIRKKVILRSGREGVWGPFWIPKPHGTVLRVKASLAFG